LAGFCFQWFWLSAFLRAGAEQPARGEPCTRSSPRQEAAALDAGPIANGALAHHSIALNPAVDSAKRGFEAGIQ
jgi:hypothetical protein